MYYYFINAKHLHLTYHVNNKPKGNTYRRKSRSSRRQVGNPIVADRLPITTVYIFKGSIPFGLFVCKLLYCRYQYYCLIWIMIMAVWISKVNYNGKVYNRRVR